MVMDHDDEYDGDHDDDDDNNDKTMLNILAILSTTALKPAPATHLLPHGACRVAHVPQQHLTTRHTTECE